MHYGMRYNENHVNFFHNLCWKDENKTHQLQGCLHKNYIFSSFRFHINQAQAYKQHLAECDLPAEKLKVWFCAPVETRPVSSKYYNIFIHINTAM